MRDFEDVEMNFVNRGVASYRLNLFGAPTKFLYLLKIGCRL